MLRLEEYKAEINGLKQKIEEMGDSLNVPELMNEAEELEQTASEEGFWDDPEASQKVLQKIKLKRDKIDGYMELVSMISDLLTLNELGIEEDDESVADEIGDGLEKVRRKYEELRMAALLTGRYDKNNAIITMHAGAGGTEAQDWVEMLLRMYTRWAEGKGYGVKIVSILPGDEAGIKSVTVSVTGPDAYGYLKSEKGVHRLVRISPFDASGRRHTSFASIDVMPEIDEEIHIEIDPDDLRIDTYRSSGAGGQHVNKTDSAIRITHLPTGIVTSCQTERSQFQNKEYAMKVLKSKLFELKEREKKEELDNIQGIQMDIAWGSQIRSYVFCPYTMVKDHRTNYEVGNVNGVMDGDLDGFINAFLSSREHRDAMDDQGSK
ncbi:MAG: peptide chain release factor 2 [Eubacteriales bacterium]|nr:peptide chain release factor 2 [Eubacteriales bacterium]